jgi:hypothetical protein
VGAYDLILAFPSLISLIFKKGRSNHLIDLGPDHSYEHFRAYGLSRRVCGRPCGDFRPYIVGILIQLMGNSSIGETLLRFYSSDRIKPYSRAVVVLRCGAFIRCQQTEIVGHRFQFCNWKL